MKLQPVMPSTNIHSLKVNEIFYSLQGEGARAGEPSIFIRLADCNLTCRFCDTEFTSFKGMTLDMLLHLIRPYSKKNIIWTGGEPAMQLTNEIVEFFNEAGYYQCIETNGSMKVPNGLNYIVVSPKVAEHVVAANFKSMPIDELRYVRHIGQLALPKPLTAAKNYYISPMFKGNQIDEQNLNHCMNLILNDSSNINWKLSIQIHKLIKIL